MANEYLRESVLPTRGLLYGGLIEGGRVLAMPWDTEFEKLLAGGSGVRDMLNVMIRRFTRPTSADRWPNDLDVRKLTLIDRHFLLFQVRMATFPKIPYGFKVPCGSCGHAVHMSVLLEDITVRLLPDDFSEPFEVTLTSGPELGLRLLRGVDEDAIMKAAQTASKASRREGPQPGDPEYALRLARHVVTVDGRDLDQLQALEFIQGLRGMDLLDIKDALDAVPCGFDADLTAVCDKCKFETEATLPWSDEFFRPRRNAGHGARAAGGNPRPDDDWKVHVPGRTQHADTGAAVVAAGSQSASEAGAMDLRTGATAERGSAEATAVTPKPRTFTAP